MTTKATDNPAHAVTYRIRDWEKHFENNRTREMVKMAWVPVPNKHDGEGFQRIMREKDGLVIYGCWHLILQVASKCLRERGTLLRDDGTPLDADAIAIKTGWRDSKDIARALAFLSSAEVGWIERLNETSESIPQEGAAIPQEGARNGMELNGTEKNEKGVELPFDSDLFKSAWEAFRQHRKAMRAKMTEHAEALALKKLPPVEHEAIAWIENAIAQGWRGIYDPNKGKAKPIAFAPRNMI